MTGNPSQARSRINQRLLAAPAGAVLTLDWLRSQGISQKLANYYVASGWLHRVGEGAFTVTPRAPDWLGAVFGLQQKAHRSFHPGGRTALELAGLAHFLPLGESERPIFLFSRSNERLPAWFRGLPWFDRVRHVRTNFLSAGLGMRQHSTGGFGVEVSAAERAVLELLWEQEIDEAGYEHARLIFEALGTLRPSVVQSLLEACRSVKVKRLFLHLAELHGHPWMAKLDLKKVSLGSGKRTLVSGGRLDPKYLITVPRTDENQPDAL